MGGVRRCICSNSRNSGIEKIGVCFLVFGSWPYCFSTVTRPACASYTNFVPYGVAGICGRYFSFTNSSRSVGLRPLSTLNNWMALSIDVVSIVFTADCWSLATACKYPTGAVTTLSAELLEFVLLEELACPDFCPHPADTRAAAPQTQRCDFIPTL